MGFGARPFDLNNLLYPAFSIENAQLGKFSPGDDVRSKGVTGSKDPAEVSSAI